MLLGHQVWFPFAEVKMYHIVLVINLSNSILRLAFVLIPPVIFKWSERKKTLQIFNFNMQCKCNL